METQLKYNHYIGIVAEHECLNDEIVQLLQETRLRKSFRRAAESMGLPYSKAWKIVKDVEAQLNIKLFVTRVGGRGGGWSRLTPECEDLLCRYHKFNKEMSETACALFKKYFGDFQANL